MNTPLLAAMIKFAQLHDWGQGAFVESSALNVYDEHEQAIVKFYDMVSLKAWAGY